MICESLARICPDIFSRETFVSREYVRACCVVFSGWFRVCFLTFIKVWFYEALGGVMKCTASYALPVFTLLLAFCHTVWSLDIVRATEGQNVLLNCSYTLQDPPLPQNPTVIWKGPTGKVLSRSTGNFTLYLPNVKKNHSGKYECHIVERQYQMDIQLNVTDKAPKTEEGAGATGGARGSHPAVCAVTLLFLYLCLFH